MKFNTYGYLPEGIHTVTWEHFEKEFGFSPRRQILMKGLYEVIQVLKQCGCEAIFIDGSMVTDKLEPDDWDACFKGNGEVIKQLYAIDADLVLDDSAKRDRQKAKYKGELYPPYAQAERDVCYIDFFQRVKGCKRKKGIIKIELS